MIAAPDVVIVENVPAPDVAAPIVVPSIAPPLISAVVITLVVNVPTLAVTLPSCIVTPSTATPLPFVFSLIVSVDTVSPVSVPVPTVRFGAIKSDPNVISPLPVYASIWSAFSVPEAPNVENVPAAGVVPPITVPSIVPPVIAAPPDASVENVPAADVVEPIATLSIAEPAAPSTSNVPSTSSNLVAPTVMSY